MKNFNDHGVTLVETVIALAVLAFGILSLMMLYTSGTMIINWVTR